MRTRIKICGITRVEDGLAAAQCGADAIGLVFWPGTPRLVTFERARAIADALPPFVSTVGLFVDPDAADVEAALSAVPLDALQFHGTEARDFCAGFGKPWLKAIHVGSGADLIECALQYQGASGLLFDTWSADGLPGGSGKSFDWTLFRNAIGNRVATPLILSGGLDPANVAAAISAVHPWAVDVSSGVERRDAEGRTQKGIKDAARIAAFVAGVRNADE
jgi:phosphoribosylanthranilate isomerase